MPLPLCPPSLAPDPPEGDVEPQALHGQEQQLPSCGRGHCLECCGRGRGGGRGGGRGPAGPGLDGGRPPSGQPCDPGQCPEHHLRLWRRQRAGGRWKVARVWQGWEGCKEEGP
ncbi:unnamed protein product [Discosporangium mesarthrocarpum]